MQTIGVSIPIPSPYADQLEEVRAWVGDPLAHFVPAHVTLMPPTEVADDHLPHLDAHLKTVAASYGAFQMTLRGTGTFMPVSPVVFAAVVEGVAHCERLESAVRGGPIERELKFPYHPHVTIAHNVDEPALRLAFDEFADWRATFVVDGFDLYEQGEDGVWRSVRRHSLIG